MGNEMGIICEMEFNAYHNSKHQLSWIKDNRLKGLSETELQNP
jgi:aminopeptidase-like protein